MTVCSAFKSWSGSELQSLSLRFMTVLNWPLSIKCRAETTSDCCWNEKKGSYFLQNARLIIICTRRMLRTTCFSSRWWGLSLFPFSVLIGRDDTRTPEQTDLNRRQRRIQMMEDGDEEKKRSNSKKGLIEAWGCWTEPWITNGCLHSLLPACRNESQPPLSAGTQSPVSSLKQKKDWEEKKKAIIKRERTRQREEEREGGGGIMRRGGGGEADVCEIREREAHTGCFSYLSVTQEDG